jgi:hypothetical protein
VEKRNLARTQDEIKTNRVCFVRASRERALRTIKAEIAKLSETGDYIMRAYMPEPSEYDVEGISFYAHVDVTHKKGPQVYRGIHPVNLVYPDSCYASLVRTILAIANNRGGELMN